LHSPHGVKCIPAVEIMYELLTPIALAHWICGDGLWNHSGLILCTDSFSIQENVKLINILMVRYRSVLYTAPVIVFILRLHLCLVYVLLFSPICTLLCPPWEIGL